jgi:hypothetical protein
VLVPIKLSHSSGMSSQEKRKERHRIMYGACGDIVQSYRRENSLHYPHHYPKWEEKIPQAKSFGRTKAIQISPNHTEKGSKYSPFSLKSLSQLLLSESLENSRQIYFEKVLQPKRFNSWRKELTNNPPPTSLSYSSKATFSDDNLWRRPSSLGHLSP